jgi:hypothetical protein
MTNKWILEVQEDPETGDAILEFPPDFLATAGWKEGDTLVWKDLGDGTWSLTKQLPDVTIEEEEAWRDLERKQTKA